MYPVFGTIQRNDPALDQLLSPDAKIQKLAEGYDWSEGPVWFAKQKMLLFSDVPRNTVYSWNEKDGADEYLKPSGYTGPTARGGEPGSNGLTRDKDGNLVLCQHGDRRVARLNKDRTFTVLADRYDGKRFNSPNDLCYDRNGNLFFTDPPYGLPKGMEDPTKELPFQGIYRIGRDGKVTLLTRDMTRPNGIALSPDEKTLYICNSDPNKAIIVAFPINSDGTLGTMRTLLDTTPLVKQGLKGLPDGLKVDQKGNLFATGPGGVLVITPQGKHLGTINTGEATANCAWGDDGSTLYITADMYLARIKTKTRGTMP
jgi:gluconolactonase